MSHIVLMQTGSSKLVGFKQSLAPDNIISSNTQVATDEELAVGTPSARDVALLAVPD